MSLGKIIEPEIISESDDDDEDSIEFADKNEDSEDDSEDVLPTIDQKIVSSKVECIFKTKSIVDYIFADTKHYNFESWKDCIDRFPKDQSVKLRSFLFNAKWDDFFDIVEKKPYFKNMEKILSEAARKKEFILPHAELVFNSLNVTSPDKIRVVFLGQDPYINVTKINSKIIPQAMGFSFSVPLGYPESLPPSLRNIYSNLYEFGHLQKIPSECSLAGWIMQGCFMINSSFTTIHKKSNAHQQIWQEFTKDLIIYLNANFENIVFLAWGKDAHKLCLNVDPSKHCIITSSHPSPFSFTNTYNGLEYGKLKNPKDRKTVTYPPFKSVDHFGRANHYLKSVNKREIFWDIIDVNIYS